MQILIIVVHEWSKSSKSPSPWACLNELWCAHTMEYYLAIKNKLLIHRQYERILEWNKPDLPLQRIIFYITQFLWNSRGCKLIYSGKKLTVCYLRDSMAERRDGTQEWHYKEHDAMWGSFGTGDNHGCNILIVMIVLQTYRCIRTH